ncbi:MAG TPA: nickel pincer cofactor biosynthesis protein LarB [Gemmatimonadales bacterium]|nr:nickel pincer cofactor biosynthesis protein LarB [Gemmatimonadales bacterium]
MNRARLETLLAEVAAGTMSPAGALDRLTHFPTEDLSFAQLDHHRALRQGQPEVVFAAGKPVDQTVAICERLAAAHGTFLCTRTSAEQVHALRERFPALEWNESGRTAWLPGAVREPTLAGELLVVTAGTSDLPVSEEVVSVAVAMGARVSRLTDVGVAGIHRLLAASEQLHRADVVVVVAGMEGALPSVVGGLISAPVIAVPTSVGYGASFGGVAALLAMLNSCAAGVTVVNIDNGFGAAMAAVRLLAGRAGVAR